MDAFDMISAARLFVLFVATLAISSACSDFQRIIDEVNNANTTWKAGRNFRPDLSCEHIKRLLGSRELPEDVPEGPRTLITYSGALLPDEFDARKQWPNCPTIDSILDQSNCGSCWAVSVASTFSDRMCIGTNGQVTLPMSPEYLMACSTLIQEECKGGIPELAWTFISTNGLVTGGGYNSGIGCQPYELPSCEHHFTNGTRPPCDTVKIPGIYGPSCKTTCTNSNYKTNFKDDFHRAKQVNYYDSVASAQEDIMKNGPITAVFDVYEDFPHYKSGVYQHLTGSYEGGHAVRVIGWGTENGTPYWLVANSWNADWGDKGIFKFKRGTDECGFEDGLASGSVA